MTNTMLEYLINAAKRSEQLQADCDRLKGFAPVMYVRQDSGRIFKEAIDMLIEKHKDLVDEVKIVLDTHSKKESE